MVSETLRNKIDYDVGHKQHYDRIGCWICLQLKSTMVLARLRTRINQIKHDVGHT